MISDRVFLSGLALLAAALVALAMVWPQGYGARSPGPFGSTPIQQTPQMKAAMQREHESAMRRQDQAKREAAAAAAAEAATQTAPQPAPAPALQPAPPTAPAPQTVPQTAPKTAPAAGPTLRPLQP